MTDRAHSSPRWPGELIEQATEIIMDRFRLDEEQALKALRKVSQNTRTQMCVVAEQIITQEIVLVEAVRDLEEDLSASADPSPGGSRPRIGCGISSHRRKIPRDEFPQGQG
jgi:ANTAR domain